MSNVCDRTKTNCHASASVKSEIHASNDLIHEMIYQHQFMSDVYDKINENKKFKLWQVSQCWSESPSSSIKESDCPRPLMRRVWKIDKGWHCSSWQKGILWVLKHRELPRHDIPPTKSSHYMSVLPPLLHAPE